MQIQVVIFDGPPQLLEEDIVLASAAAVHADADGVVFENSGEAGAGKLGALIGVEDLRLAIAAEGFLKGLHTEIRFQAIGLKDQIVASCNAKLNTQLIPKRVDIDDSIVYRILSFFSFSNSVNGLGCVMVIPYSMRYKIGNFLGCSNEG